MARYIDADAFLQTLAFYDMAFDENRDFSARQTILQIMHELNHAPTADVEEVKDCEKCEHFDKHSTQPICISCSNRYPNNFKPKMDGGKAE